MSGDPQTFRTGWGHRIREENRGLREKVVRLQKESRGLHRELQNSWNLLEHVPGSLIIVQQEKILFANETACRETGYTREQLMSMRVSDLLDSDEISFHLRSSRQQPSPLHPYETSLKTREGRSLSAELRIGKTVYQGKTALLFHFIPVDQRKTLERQRTEAERAAILLRMAYGFRQQLDRCNRMLREGMAWNQGPGVYQDAILRALSGIDSISENEALLSQRLRCLARTEYDPSELALVGLNRLIEAAVDVVCPTADDGSTPDGAPVAVNTFLRAPSKVYGCCPELREVFENMILNAVESLPEGGDVYLTTEEHSGFAHVYIQDNGVGMPEGIIDKVFDPFFTTKDGTWRGLGLSLSHAIIGRHQGEIDISSQEGRGSTFLVKLPLARDIASPMKTASPKKELRDSHLLIIGNEGVLTDILYTLFAPRCDGITVVSAYRDGLRLLKDTTVDLIIADQKVFPADAGRVIGRMKELQPGLRVALINTGRTRGVDPEKGPDLVVSRPLDADRFVLQTAELLAQRGRSNG